MTNRNGQTLTWNHENRLEAVRNGSTVTEQYLYDDTGQRIKKWSSSSALYYAGPHYEVEIGNCSVSAASLLAQLATNQNAESETSPVELSTLYLPLAIHIPELDENGMAEAEYDALLQSEETNPNPELVEGSVEAAVYAEQGQSAIDATSTVKYYFFVGQRIAMEESSGSFRYLHNDHLGSTVSSTNWGSGTYRKQKYYAAACPELAEGAAAAHPATAPSQPTTASPTRSWIQRG